jgi:hypothetical protein
LKEVERNQLGEWKGQQKSTNAAQPAAESKSNISSHTPERHNSGDIQDRKPANPTTAMVGSTSQTRPIKIAGGERPNETTGTNETGISRKSKLKLDSCHNWGLESW